ncbi:S1 family peptidase [Paenibacillus sp. GbtcB18]|uniref:S1 family peptidase n=1 Tax=Paenibacillus sp. GbtcB18 TaxID=2824763 RepID=UPI001C30842C|nr:S1 family peptidase [Paenibacillus sp. GbtcB18]
MENSQETEPTFVIALAKQDKNSDDFVASLKETMPKVKVVRVKNSYKDLETIKEDIRLQWPVYEAQGAIIISTGISTSKNKVILTAQKFPENLKKLVQLKYGKDIEFEIDEKFVIPQPSGSAARFKKWNTLGGGIGISSSSGDCSTAATGTKNGVRFIITAGHCVKNNGGAVWQFENLSENFVGVQHFDARNSHGDRYGIDLGLVRITDTARTLSNYVLKNGTSGYDANFNSTGNFYEFQNICKAGITTDYTCGLVGSVSRDAKYTDGYTYKDVAQLDSFKSGETLAKPGDSGGTVWSGETLLGVISGVGTFTYAAKISYVPSLFGNDFQIKLN